MIWENTSGNWKIVFVIQNIEILGILMEYCERIDIFVGVNIWNPEFFINASNV